MSLLKDQIELQIQEAELATQKNLDALPKGVKWFLIGSLIALIPAYFITKAITKQVTLNDYGKNTLVAHASFSNPKAPITSNVTLTLQSNGAYAAVFSISNHNFDLSLDQVPYEVDFYDSQKEQVYSYKDKFYLLPNQTKFLSVPTFTAPQQIAYTNIVLPKNLPWQRRLQTPKVNLVTSQPQTTQQLSPLQFVVTGNFLNQSAYTLGDVRLVFILYDSSNNVIGTSQRDEFTVGPNERRAYTQLWPGQSGSNVAKVDVEAYTDILDPNNLSAQAASSNSASDLSRPSTR